MGEGGLHHPTSAGLANHRKNVAGPHSMSTLSSISIGMKKVPTVHQPQVARWEYRKKKKRISLSSWSIWHAGGDIASRKERKDHLR